MNKTYNTNINDILLTALACSLSDIKNNDTNYILFKSTGREYNDETIDISKTVGCFTSIFPICLNKKDDLSECVIENKENFRLIPNKGILFGKYNDYINTVNLSKVSINYYYQIDDWIHELSEKKEFNNNENYININIMEKNKNLEFKIETNLLNSSLFAENYKSNLIKLIVHLNDLKRTFLTSNDINYIIDQKSLKNIQSAGKVNDIFYFIEKLFCSDKKSPYFFEQFIICNENLSYDNKKPIFLFPPGNGGAESYLNNIVPYLGKNKLVLFNNIIIHLQNLNLLDILNKISLLELAKYHLKIIKTIQPDGPYNFFGWSAGGNLAIEIARILKEDYNESVANIFLIDSIIETTKMNFVSEVFPINIKFEPYITNIDSNVVLFKAMKFKDNLLEIDRLSINDFSNLDYIVDKKYIQLIPMYNNDHHSCMSDKDELSKISKLILDLI